MNLGKPIINDIINSELFSYVQHASFTIISNNIEYNLNCYITGIIHNDIRNRTARIMNIAINNILWI